MESTIVVTKKSFHYSICEKCNGTGQIERIFRSMKFVSDCPQCDGTGRRRFIISSEIPLKDALKELKVSD